MAGEVVDSIGLGFTGDASSLLSAFTRSLNALDKFEQSVTQKAGAVTSVLDTTFGAASRTVAALTGDVRTLDKSLRNLADAENKAKEGFDKGADGAEKTAKATKETTDAVRRLSLEYRAGKIDLDGYVGKLKDLAKSSEDGSDRQLHALAGLRDAQDKVAQAAENAAKREITASEKAARAQELQLSRVLKMVNTVGSGLKSAGAGLTKFLTVPLVGAGAYAFKVTLDSNEAFTQVRKQNQDATEAQLAAVKKQLRAASLDPTVGSNFVELSNIASEGSQQGIQLPNLAEFTKEVAYVGQAGDVSGQQAATGLAKIAMATKTPQNQIKNMASALVSMGKEGASTLGEVLDVAQRFASETRLAKLKPSDLYAYSNAVVTMGQNAEAGGSALTKSFEKADRAVNRGGAALDAYANAAGMTSAKFVKAWRDDAGTAFLAFLAGVDKAGAVAGRTDQIMDGIGVKQIAEKTALKNLAAGHVSLAHAMEVSQKAYEAGDEQKKKAEEQARSYKSQLKELQREVEADANVLGEALVPALLDVVKAGRPFLDAVRDAAQRFHELSPEAQEAWLKVGLGLALLGPLVSGLGNAVLWVVKLREAFALVKALQTARELSEAAKAAKDVATAAEGAAGAAGRLAPNINTVASSATGAAGEVSVLSQALAALGSTAPITIPIIIAAAIAAAVAKDSTDRSEENIARMEETGASTAQRDIAAARKTISDLREYQGQLKNAGYATSHIPDSDMQGKLGLGMWDAPGRPNLDTVLGRQGKGGTRTGGTIDKQIAAQEAAIKRSEGIIAGAATQKGRETSRASIEGAAAQAETEIGKNIVRSAAASNLGGKNLQAGCAIFVSSVLKKAGADFDGSPVAKDLRDKLIKQGGRAKDMKDAKPGDIVFFEGKNFGAIKQGGKGFHTGVYMGNGQIRDEGGRGVSTRSISSITKNQPDATVYAVSVPDKLTTSRMVRIMNGDVPFNPALFKGKEKKGKNAPSVRPDVQLPPMEDLTPIEELFSGKPLSSLPTTAKNYADKKRELDDRFAERRNAARDAGKPLDEHRDGVQEQTQNKTLAMNALRNTDKAITELLPKLEKEKQTAEAAQQAYNGIAHAMTAKGAAHQQITDAERQEEAGAKKRYRDAIAAYRADAHALEENKRVHSDALRDKTAATEALTELQKKQSEKELKEQEATRKKWLAGLKTDLEQGKITRLQYEEQIKAGITRIGVDNEQAGPAKAALSDSETDRTKATADTRRKTLTMNDKDFTNQREALKEEVAELKRKGVDDKTVAGYEAGKNREIDLAEWTKKFHEGEEKIKADLDDGKVSLSEYKAYLEHSLDAASKKFGEHSVEASKLIREIDHVSWQQADESANRFRQSLDNGDISLQQYIAQMKALQAELPETSSEYRKLGSDIDQANRRMIASARQTSDRIGSEFGQGIVRALRRQSSFSGVLREMFNKAVDDAAASAMKRMVSNLVFKWLNKGDQGKVAAEEKQIRAAGVQNTAADKELQAARLQKEASENQLKAAQMGQSAPSTPNGEPGAGDGTAGAAGALGKDWVTAALDKYGINASDVGNAENVASIAQGQGGRATIPGADGTTNMAATAGMNAASAGAFGASAAAAMPYVAGALAVSSLVMGFLNKPQKPDFNTKTGEGRYAFLGDGDHTGLIDSGYSGVEGMRKLQAARDARNATGAAASGGNQTTNHIAAGAITIITRAGDDHMTIAQQVMKELSAQTGFDNSLTGNG